MANRLFAIALCLTVEACSSTGATPPASSAPQPMRIARSASNGFELLYVFQTSAQGTSPFGGVFVDASGTIFGTTSGGGVDNCGTFFKLTPADDFYTETILHSFSSSTDGCAVRGTPVPDPTTGAFYMTAIDGGKSQLGTTVLLTPESGGYRETGVFSYTAHTGGYPNNQIAQIGSTIYTLQSGSGPQGDGSIVGLTQAGLKVDATYLFPGGALGRYPQGGLIADSSGNLYGTAESGGSMDFGLVFKFVPNESGGVETVLWNFTSAAGDGAYPDGALVRDERGNLYGTTLNGGTFGLGTIFKLTPSGSTYRESILHSFGNSRDGSNASAGLVLVKDTLWGTTFHGGAKPCACGTLFSISTTGLKYRVNHSFDGKLTGSTPFDGLYWDGHAFYGTAAAGGSAFNGGTVYQFVP